MILLQSGFVDVLKPKKGVFSYYELFLVQYSLITVTAIMSQGSFDSENFENINEEDFDKNIDELIKSISLGAVKKRQIYPLLCFSMGVDPGETVQETEERVFATDFFTENAKKYSLSNREMILRGLNLSAFLNYFFLLEDSLKKIYIDLIKPTNKFIKGSEVIDVCLREIISMSDVYDCFEKELHKRSKVIPNIKSLSALWGILNLIRNQITHANGFYDKTAKKSFYRRSEDFLKQLRENSDCVLSISEISNSFLRYENQINSDGFLIIDDEIENIIRNISVFVMESLYVCNLLKKNKS
ncbi:hypothetical protein LNA76_04390 [Alcaligenes sp. MMA]|uniref:hypothetical protein n=1 Tax=Alcaligenes sp. MMA TaxID=2893019 RepID=UPI001E385674|nr:hypothetical protein [Alcaligenes sp. MMA]MCC9162559.1 hypothetical protein [Alcaligenes sp. MMA]